MQLFNLAIIPVFLLHSHNLWRLYFSFFVWRFFFSDMFAILWWFNHQVMPNPYNPMDCPCSSVHNVSQARILEWVAVSFSRASSQPRDRTWVSCLVGGFFTDWATRETSLLFYTEIILFTYKRIKNIGNIIFVEPALEDSLNAVT